ncbi:MAG: hypothetical protein QOE25_1058 [Actinomycetota bacterium]|nr:hypothetical protein [Actinomycetota bacterium]
MTRWSGIRRMRSPAIVTMIVATVLTLTFGLALAAGLGTSSPLPCSAGGPGCDRIGFTHAWFNGRSVNLEYSHQFFCAQPPSSEAESGCEAGTVALTPPPSGPVVSNLYVLVPMGFTAPAATVQCGTRCIDQPNTLDMESLGGNDNATFPQRSFVIEDKESFQSTWWPVVVVGVKNIDAWNTIAAAKTIDSVDACQASGGCMTEADTTAFVFFQVLGPGMSPQGPA